MRGIFLTALLLCVSAQGAEPISFKLVKSEDGVPCARPDDRVFLSSKRILATGKDLSSATLRFVRKETTDTPLHEYGYDRKRGHYEVTSESTAGEIAGEDEVYKNYVIGVKFKRGHGKRVNHVLRNQFGNYVGLVAGRDVLWAGCIETYREQREWGKRSITSFELRLDSQETEEDAEAILDRIRAGL